MIKKIICFYSLSVLLIFSSYSQKFELGLKAGPNFASQKISTITNPQSITGYHLGGFMYIKLPILFGIQVEGQYSKLGSEFQINQLINNIFQFKDYEWYYAVNDGLAQADDPCIMVLSGHSYYVNSVCYSPDGKTLASGSDDKTVRIWDVMSGECVHVLNGHSSYVISV